MERHIFYHEDSAYIRINKSAARARYNSCEDIILTPVYLDPIHYFNLSITVNKLDWGNDSINFDKLVDNYELFNCRDIETGRYAAYYYKVKNIFPQKGIPE